MREKNTQYISVRYSAACASSQPWDDEDVKDEKDNGSVNTESAGGGGVATAL